MPTKERDREIDNGDPRTDLFVAVSWYRYSTKSGRVETLCGSTWKHAEGSGTFYIYVFLGEEAKVIYGVDRLLVPRVDITFSPF